MVLVTGLTGRTGRWFYRRLLAEREVTPIPLRAVFRPGRRDEEIENGPLPVEILHGDLRDEEFLFAAMEGVDTVLHISSIFFSPPIARAAARAGVKRLIFVHTTGIYSKFKSARGNYLEIEEEVYAAAEAAGADLTILRPTMIYGSMADNNVIQFIRMVDRLRLFPVVDHAKYPLQPVHAADLGDAYYEILLRPEVTAGKTYVLSGETPITLMEMLITIGQEMGKTNTFLSVPLPLAYAGACLLWALSFGKKDYRERVQRLAEPRAYPHEEAIRDFGYAPRSFADGVRGEVQEYLQATGRSHPEDGTQPNRV